MTPALAVRMPASALATAHDAPARGESAAGWGDPAFLGAVVALAVLGLLTVYTSSAAIALDRHGTPHHFVLRHAMHLAVGALALALAWRLDYRRLDHSGIVHAGWVLVMALLVLVLFTEPVGGARRWLRPLGLSVQPAELAKIAVVVLASFQLARRLDRLADAWRGLLPPLLLVGQVAVLVALQPDFGTAVGLLLLFLLLAFVAGAPLRLLAGLGAGAAAVVAVHLVQEPYRLARLRAFLDPLADPLGAGFQARQSLIAIGSGGLFGRSGDGLLGTGLGASLQKLFFLPEPHTDFVFAVLCEELGLLGGGLVLVLFAVVLWRGLKVAAAAPDAFGTLLATGATAMLAGQALANVLVVVGLLPTKGLPLPFLSAGGSSLVVSCLAAGLILGVSRHGS